MEMTVGEEPLSFHDRTNISQHPLHHTQHSPLCAVTHSLADGRVTGAQVKTNRHIHSLLPPKPSIRP